MSKFFIKLVFVGACSIIGYLFASMYYNFPLSSLGFIFGLFVAVIVLRIEYSLRSLSLRIVMGGLVGLAVGLLFAYLIIFVLQFVPGPENQKSLPWRYLFSIFIVILAYLGLMLGAKKGEEIKISDMIFAKSTGGESEARKILDTSVIIDGRMADICDTGFIEGTLNVPRFVLDELQLIADSSDPMKRSRGRRGLDILNRMQKSTGIKIDIIDIDFPKLKGVDAKLVALAKKEGGKIVTNDYNLNKVAELQGIKILNINELANALKPLVLPGEAMVVKTIKEGKEPGQGVAYLDDGTMVIVDNGSKYIKQTVEVTVTSVLQTTAGRMIFSTVKEANSNNRKGQ